MFRLLESLFILGICKLILGFAEGCDIYSPTPVCDADSTSLAIEDSAIEKIGNCVACKKSG